MIRETWNGLSPHARGLLAAAAVGFVIGAVFGDMVFVVIELAIGDPWDELVFGVAGAALASVCYEIATMGRSRR
jgi:hypothetical protein